MTGVLSTIHGDARRLPLANNSVDLIVTSPPYFALRSYTDGGEHYQGQIGAEPTPAEFITSLIECTREWVRLLKPSGSLWVNLGDKYAMRDGQGGPQGVTGSRATRRQAATYADAEARDWGTRAKSLLGLPWRYALACIDELGLILRAEVIWSKPNGLPESVTDRVRRSHEQWFHFTVQPRYYSAVDEIREAHIRPKTAEQLARDISTSKSSARRSGVGGEARGEPVPPPHLGTGSNPLGKLPGSVWTIPTEPVRVPPELGVDHFAAFPSEWPRRLILGWSPRAVCTVCGEGRRPVATARTTGHDNNDDPGRRRSTVGLQGDDFRRWRVENPRTIAGYACPCPDTTAPTTPGVVLDPFGGTGTTAHVAAALGRTGVSVDLSADYCRLAAHPFLRDRRAAKVLGVDKPAKQLPGQAGLFDLDGDAA